MSREYLRPFLCLGLVGVVGLSMPVRAAVGASPIADAVMHRDQNAVRVLLQKGVDVNIPQGDGMTALHWAAATGDAELATLLVNARAAVNPTTRISAETPLHVAGKMANAPVVDVLLRAGANVNAATTVGTTPLMLAAGAGSAEAVKLLLAHGANVNAKEVAKGHTALMFAAAANRSAVVKLLLESRADAGATTTVFDLSEVQIPPDRTAQANASSGGQRDSQAGRPQVAGLERRYRQNELVAAQGGLTALHFAARQGNTEAVKAFLDGGVDINQQTAGVEASALLLAIINGHFDLAMYMLDHGANPNLVAENGVAPLYAVVNLRWIDEAEYPQPRVYLEQKTSYLQILQALLDHGADPNIRLTKKVWYSGYGRDNSGVDEMGSTAFWRAAYSNDVDSMRLLLARGADPNIPTVTVGRPQPAANGVPGVPSGGPNGTPLHAATGDGHLQSFAQANGHRTHPAGWLPAVKYLVEEVGLDVNARDANGNTPLHYAAARGDNEMVLYLVSKGANVMAVNRRGQTTADAANGPLQRIQPFPETVTLLESLGAKNNHRCVSC